MFLKQMFCEHKYVREETAKDRLPKPQEIGYREYTCIRCGKSEIFNADSRAKVFQDQTRYTGDENVHKGETIKIMFDIHTYKKIMELLGDRINVRINALGALEGELISKDEKGKINFTNIIREGDVLCYVVGADFSVIKKQPSE